MDRVLVGRDGKVRHTRTNMLTGKEESDEGLEKELKRYIDKLRPIEKTQEHCLVKYRK